MITRTPFSTISYNTDSFLIYQLDQMIEERIINFYAFIIHKAEEDETKDHKHLLLIPNGMQDTFQILSRLEEPDPDNDKPLKCMAAKHSQFADWYLYALHDKDYLYTKGIERRYHYLRDDFYTSDDDYFLELIHTSDFSRWKKIATFRECISKGEYFVDLVKNGFVPVQQIFQFEKAFLYLCKHVLKTFNFDGRTCIFKDGHYVDVLTGALVGVDKGESSDYPKDPPQNIKSIL